MSSNDECEFKVGDIVVIKDPERFKEINKHWLNIFNYFIPDNFEGEVVKINKEYESCCVVYTSLTNGIKTDVFGNHELKIRSQKQLKIYDNERYKDVFE